MIPWIDFEIEKSLEYIYHSVFEINGINMYEKNKMKLHLLYEKEATAS
jgi:hypothetical protein